MRNPSRVGFEESDNLAGDGLGPANVADALSGLGLDVDRPGRQGEKAGETRADVGLDRPELRLLNEDNHVYIDRAPARAAQALERLTQEQSGVRASVSRVGVGKGVADVAQAGGA